MIDLVSERVGGTIVDCNDEFFAPAANLLKTGPPVAGHEYTDHGKWMDGWETRRRRGPGHDWVVISLGIPGRVRRVTVDTSHFTGNHPDQFSLDASPGNDVWRELVPRTTLRGDTEATFDVDDPRRVVAVRLNIHPDGGIARLRVEGDPVPDLQAVCPDGPTDLVAAAVGGRWLEASDHHYASPSNLLLPRDSAGMWDGWETRRRRGPGHDWATFRLGLAGIVERVVVDTTHFKGNCPGWVSVELSEDGTTWSTTAERATVEPDAVNDVPVSPTRAGYVRLSLHPDGGVARFRVLGRPDRDAAVAARLRYLNSLFEEAAQEFFLTACASSAWVDAMVSGRPFQSVDAVHGAAERAFDRLTEADWLEAFAGHPRIGERGDATTDREQAATSSAPQEVIDDLDDVNRRYEDKFGFTYIVYATGRSAEEMLAIARERLGNDREQEVANAATAQRRITATRLRRMLCQEVR